MTLIEVFIVVFILVALLAMLWPQTTGRRHCTLRPTCSNNLMQLAIAMRVWEGDHNDKFPMGLSVTNGGTKELMETPEAWKAFQVMSNEIATPLILRCPEDSTRTNFTKGFGDELKNNISYFIGIVADDSDPQSILSGDDNFRLNNSPVSTGHFNITSNSEVEWDSSRHFYLDKQGWFRGSTTNYGYLMCAAGLASAASSSEFKNSVQQNYLGLSSHIAIP